MYKNLKLVPANFGLVVLTCSKEITWRPQGPSLAIYMASALFFLPPSQFLFIFWTNLRTNHYIFSLFGEHKIFLPPPGSSSDWFFPNGSTIPSILLSKDLSFSCNSVSWIWENGRAAYSPSLFWPFYPERSGFSQESFLCLHSRLSFLNSSYQRSVYLFTKYILLLYVICWPLGYRPIFIVLVPWTTASFFLNACYYPEQLQWQYVRTLQYSSSSINNTLNSSGLDLHSSHLARFYVSSWTVSGTKTPHFRNQKFFSSALLLPF